MNVLRLRLAAYLLLGSTCLSCGPAASDDAPAGGSSGPPPPVIPAPPGSPAVPEWKEAEQIGPTGAPGSYEQKIAMNSLGDAVATWVQHEGLTSTLWANRRAGGSWTGAVMIAGSSASSPRVAIDFQGNALVVCTLNQRVMSVRYDVNGGWGSPVAVHDSVNIQGGATVAMDGNGNALAVWLEYTNYPNESRTWGNRYAAGSGWQAAQALEPLANVSRQCDVALGPQGAGVAVWQSPDSPFFNVRFAPFDGASWQLPVGWMALEMEAAPLANGIGSLGSLPAVEMDSGGNAMVIWLVQDGLNAGLDMRTSLRAVRYDAVTGWGLAGSIEPHDSMIRNPSLAMSPAGSAFVLWEQRPDADAEHVIWSVRYDPQSGWASPVAIGTGIEPRVVAASDGKAVAVWSLDASVASSFYDPATGWQDPEVIENNSGNTSNVDVAMTAGGKAVAVWRQYMGNGLAATWANRRE